ncbi:entericidin A/B family lipoprotein, partial [Streptococcus suis]
PGSDRVAETGSAGHADPVRERFRTKGIAIPERSAVPNIGTAPIPFHRGEDSMRKLLGFAVVAGALMVTACNTVEGMGKDVSSAGNTVAKTADKSK